MRGIHYGTGCSRYGRTSSNLDAASILDLRKILAFWKSQGKTIIVSEHRLYYLRGLADRFIYLADGQVSHDYSAAEFEQLTEQQRSDMGLRTFALERLLPPVLPQQAKTALALRNFHFAYKNEPETLHIMDCEIPTNRIVGIIGNNGAGKSTFFTLFLRLGEALWGDCRGTKEIPIRKEPAELPAIWSCRR